MSTPVQNAIAKQRRILADWLSSSLSILAEDCRECWSERPALEARLSDGMNELPYCKHLFVLDQHARQITANVGRTGLLTAHFGRDRSQRPYLQGALQGATFHLSEAYISQNKKRPSLTAVQRITSSEGVLLGYLGADFDLRELPATQSLYNQAFKWMQMKGDPAVRAGLFYQQRIDSPMDQNLDAILALLKELYTVHGVFHSKIHFSSSRLSLWLVDDPFSYRMHGIDDLLDPDLCLAYPRRPYTERACLPPEKLQDVLNVFKQLRFMDETIYLRSASLNIVNGLVGLTFSCDGSHYMPWQEFLDKDMGFWFGTGSPP